VNALALEKHLADVHRIDWADGLDADLANRLHHHVHSHDTVLDDDGHEHCWDGLVADAQPPDGRNPA
jgi:hypothetical protein